LSRQQKEGKVDNKEMKRRQTCLGNLPIRLFHRREEKTQRGKPMANSLKLAQPRRYLVTIWRTPIPCTKVVKMSDEVRSWDDLWKVKPTTMGFGNFEILGFLLSLHWPSSHYWRTAEPKDHIIERPCRSSHASAEVAKEV
jgi:hypothetical protein